MRQQNPGRRPLRLAAALAAGLVAAAAAGPVTATDRDAAKRAGGVVPAPRPAVSAVATAVDALMRSQAAPRPEGAAAAASSGAAPAPRPAAAPRPAVAAAETSPGDGPARRPQAAPRPASANADLRPLARPAPGAAEDTSSARAPAPTAVRPAPRPRLASDAAHAPAPAFSPTGEGDDARVAAPPGEPAPAKDAGRAGAASALSRSPLPEAERLATVAAVMAGVMVATRSTPRPAARGVGTGDTAAWSSAGTLAPVRLALRPAPRPAAAAAPLPHGSAAAQAVPASLSARSAVAQPAVALASPLAVARSRIPGPRPEAERRRFLQRAAVVRTQPAPGVAGRSSSGLCGVAGIEGRAIPPVVSDVRGCGVADAVRVSAVDGVQLSRRAILDCETARALHSWVRNGLRPAVGGLGGGPAQLQVAAHYVCRTRNHRPNAPISEHGRGRAIDISAIRLVDGQEMTILRHWRDRRYGPVLRNAHRAACGPFNTTLGPGSDGMHEDHLHFDTRRGGRYCR